MTKKLLFSIIFKVKKKDKVKDLLQKVFDNVFQNIEINIRELGYGDTKVNKTMKTLNKIFFDFHFLTTSVKILLKKLLKTVVLAMWSSEIFLVE